MGAMTLTAIGGTMLSLSYAAIATLAARTLPALGLSLVALASCQSKTQPLPPPGETPAATAPVALPVPAGQAVASAQGIDVKTVAPTSGVPGTVRTGTLATTTRAQAAISGLGGSKVSGSLMLQEMEDGGVSIEGTISGLTPGLHGFHVHEHGNCSAKDGTSAGGHFNPTEADHGDTDHTVSHMGDLGNVEADAQGVARVHIVKKPATLRAGPSSFLGRAFIVHAQADDLKSQPAGDAGQRLGCGVIVPVT